MNWEGKRLSRDRNQGIEILKCEAILISFDCCATSGIIFFHPITEKHNSLIKIFFQPNLHILTLQG
jgi:hypothetical protein